MNPSLRKKILSVQPRYHQLKIPFIDSPLDPATMSPGQDAIQLHHRPWYAGRVQCLRIPANGEHIHLIDVDLSWSDQDKIITVPFIGHLWQERDHTRRFHHIRLHAGFDHSPLRGYYDIFASVDGTSTLENSWLEHRFCGDAFIFRLQEDMSRVMVHENVPDALLQSDLLIEMMAVTRWKRKPDGTVQLGFWRMQEAHADQNLLNGSTPCNTLGKQAASIHQNGGDNDNNYNDDYCIKDKYTQDAVMNYWANVPDELDNNNNYHDAAKINGNVNNINGHVNDINGRVNNIRGNVKNKSDINVKRGINKKGDINTSGEINNNGDINNKAATGKKGGRVKKRAREEDAPPVPGFGEATAAGSDEWEHRPKKRGRPKKVKV